MIVDIIKIEAGLVWEIQAEQEIDKRNHTES